MIKLCTLVMLSFCLISFTLPVLSDTTVSINSGFENEGSCIATWDTPQLACPSSYYGYQPDSSDTDFGLKKIHGNNVLSVKINSAEGYTRAGVTQKITGLQVGETYRFSIFVKTIDFEGQSRLIITEKDDNNVDIDFDEVYGTSQNSAWQKLEIVKSAQKSNVSFSFTAMTSTNFAGEYCNKDCGEVQYDNFTIEKLSSPIAAYQKISNPCEEGYFLSTTSMLCQPLTKDFGFSHADFALSATNLVIEQDLFKCNQSDLLASIETIKVNGGGTLQLPACTIEIDSPFWLPNNIKIQGAGIGKTIIHAPSWETTTVSMMHIENPDTKVFARPEVKNVIISDLSFTGDESIAEQKMTYLSFSDSQNILVERVEFMSASRSNISFNRSQNITLRYIFSQGAYWHGIGTKDCFPETSMDTDNSGLISKQECAAIAGGEHLYWSENISIHSNVLFENKGMGIDSHASNAEVAGNELINNYYGSKFPEPATGLWIHHNVFSGNTRHGSSSKTQYCGTVDTSMLSSDHVYYHNRYNDNSSTINDFAFRVDNVENVILLENEQYENNGPITGSDYNKARIGERCENPNAPFTSTVFYCEGDVIGEGAWAANTPPTGLASSDSRCNIDDVSNIFN